MIKEIFTHLLALAIGGAAGFIVCYIREKKGMNDFK